jgi:hypothetical protein
VQVRTAQDQSFRLFLPVELIGEHYIEASREGREPTRMRVSLAALMSRATSPYVFASIR